MFSIIGGKREVTVGNGRQRSATVGNGLEDLAPADLAALAACWLRGDVTCSRSFNRWDPSR